MSKSLVQEFDELTRQSSTFHNGCETEFLQFVGNQRECMRGCLSTKDHSRKLQQELRDVIKNNERREEAARRLLNNEMAKRRHAEGRVKELETIMLKIRDVVQHDDDKFSKTMAICECISTASNVTPVVALRDSEGSMFDDLDFDRSQDDMCSSRIIRSSRRPSLLNVTSTFLRPKQVVPVHVVPDIQIIRPSSSNGTTVCVTEASSSRQTPMVGAAYQTNGFQNDHQNTPCERGFPMTPRSSSVLSLASLDEKTPLACSTFCQSGPSLEAAGIANGRYPTPYVVLEGAAVATTSNFQERGHTFSTKTLVRFLKCCGCGKMAKFGHSALKCELCNAICHMACGSKVPLPCIPVNKTSPRSFLVALADCAPTIPPMIPSLVVHCISEIERQGLKDIGLYILNVPRTEADILKNSFLRGKYGPPNLSGVDIHVLCGCLKLFFQSMEEPLITCLHWKKVAEAAEGNGDLKIIISDLPQPNRDTLAFLILHLQRVAAEHECNKMSASVLAKEFGPFIVGYSEADPRTTIMVNDVSKQKMVVEKLMCLPADYWSAFLDMKVTRPQESLVYTASVETPKVPAKFFAKRKNLYQSKKR